MRLFIGGNKGLVLYEDAEITTLSLEDILCLKKPSLGTVLAGTSSGQVLFWEGNGDARIVAKDLGDSVHSLETTADGKIFAGSLPARGWISKDKGGSWDEISAFATAPNYEEWTAPWGTPLASTITAHPKQAKTLYFGVEVGGIYRTRDAGRKFFDLGIPEADVHAAQVSPAKHERVYVTTSAGAFCSDDEGFNWRKMGTNNKRQYTMGLAAHPVEADRVIISAASGPPPLWKRSGARCDVYLSTDAGRRFRTVAKDLKGGVQRKALVINPKVPSEIVFGTSTGELYYSNDGGEKFDKVASKLGDVQAIAFA
jgi:photosystem II stability/assembly factor-like uncharacterized protein